VLIPDRTVYWFVIFGWSGIAATFCPTVIMSLFWSGLTRRGVVAAMLTGFLCVPLFKFVVFASDSGAWLTDLSELPPAFVLSFIAGAVASVTDSAGQLRIRDGAKRDLVSAGAD
jgi:Na+/proline symporter